MAKIGGRLLFLVLFSIVAVEFSSQRKDDGIEIESVCLDNPKLVLRSISKVRDLIESSKHVIGDTCHKYSEAFLELDEILATVQTGNICNTQLVDKIRKYHKKFVYTGKDGGQRAEKTEAPLALRQFFMSLCFQISAECKMALINNLEYDTKDSIQEEDYATIKVLEKYGAVLLSQDETVKDFDDIIFLSDLKMTQDDSDEAGQEFKLTIQMHTNQLIKELIRTCSNKFKPFYDKLILPIIQLSNLGYNYQGELLARELEELKKNKLVHRWYNIVQTCEAFRMMNIYEDPEKQAGNNSQVVTFVTSAEEEYLRSKQLRTVNEELDEDFAHEKPIRYEPIASKNDDELWIQNQKELEKLIKSYQYSSTEGKRIRNKILKTVMNKLKEKIKSGSLIFNIRDIAKCNFKQATCSTQDTNVNQDLVRVLDDAVHEYELEGSESPVSGWWSSDSATNARGQTYPARVKYIPQVSDQTKITKKATSVIDKFFPSKTTIFCWIIGLMGILFLFLKVLTA